MSKPRLVIWYAIVLLAIALPVLAHWLRRGSDPGCALDGQRIDPLYRVRIVDQQQQTSEFCCIRCAELWLDRQPLEIPEVFVTDESSGQEILATTAYFVRNLVVTMQSTGNRVHVFKHEDEAEKNASMFRGTVLHGRQRPFQQRH